MCLKCSGRLVPCPVKDVDQFSQRRLEVISKATGNQDAVQVQCDNWDESRLRALCARHGWEFEWMTEDGERRRRAQERKGLFSVDKDLHAAAKAAARSSSRSE